MSCAFRRDQFTLTPFYRFTVQFDLTKEAATLKSSALLHKFDLVKKTALKSAMTIKCLSTSFDLPTKTPEEKVKYLIESLLAIL